MLISTHAINTECGFFLSSADNKIVCNRGPFKPTLSRVHMWLYDGQEPFPNKEFIQFAEKWRLCNVSQVIFITEGIYFWYCNLMLRFPLEGNMAVSVILLSKPQPNLNTTVGFYTKMTLQPPPPTTTTTHHTNSMSAISQLLLTRF